MTNPPKQPPSIHFMADLKRALRKEQWRRKNAGVPFPVHLTTKLTCQEGTELKAEIFINETGEFV